VVKRITLVNSGEYYSRFSSEVVITRITLVNSSEYYSRYFVTPIAVSLEGGLSDNADYPCEL